MVKANFYDALFANVVPLQCFLITLRLHLHRPLPSPFLWELARLRASRLSARLSDRVSPALCAPFSSPRALRMRVSCPGSTASSTSAGERCFQLRWQ